MSSAGDAQEKRRETKPPIVVDSVLSFQTKDVVSCAQLLSEQDTGAAVHAENAGCFDFPDWDSWRMNRVARRAAFFFFITD
jgi:hypothetical protein